MDEDLAKLVCPHCSASTTASTSGQSGTCPHCGRGLAAAETDAAEGMLIADLREAFGFDGDAFGVYSARRSWRWTEQRSNVFGSALGAAFLPPGSHLGDFEILGELGRGGMGIVYRARQVSLSREVALKVLPGYARYGRSAVRRFRAEAQAAARLHHTNVVSIYAQGECDGHFYYAMELIDRRRTGRRHQQPTGPAQRDAPPSRPRHRRLNGARPAGQARSPAPSGAASRTPIPRRRSPIHPNTPPPAEVDARRLPPSGRFGGGSGGRPRVRTPPRRDPP